MGYVAICCAICEGPADLEQDTLENAGEDTGLGTDFPTKAERERVTWMVDRVGLTETEGGSAVWRTGQGSPDSVDNNVPLEISAWDGLGGFDDGDFMPFNEDGALVGLACHQACYDLLVKRLQYRLKLKDVRHLATNPWESKLLGADYGGIAVYQEQYFAYLSAVEDGNAWMLENPCTCERNARRILDVWRPFVQPIVQKAKDQDRLKRNPSCITLFCCFRHAAQHVASATPPQQSMLWRAMAAIPAEVLQLIVLKADLAYTESMADAPI